MVRILVVDDSVFSQKVVANLLCKLLDDPEIFYANDGQEGFTKYSEIKPDCVILDLLMPKINGKELIKLINEYYDDAKIVVLSADVQKNVRDEIESLGVRLFLNKPFNEQKAQLVCEMIRNKEIE